MGAPLHCYTCAGGGKILKNWVKVEPKWQCGVMVEAVSHHWLHLKNLYWMYRKCLNCHRIGCHGCGWWGMHGHNERIQRQGPARFQSTLTRFQLPLAAPPSCPSRLACVNHWWAALTPRYHLQTSCLPEATPLLPCPPVLACAHDCQVVRRIRNWQQGDIDGSWNCKIVMTHRCFGLGDFPRWNIVLHNPISLP
jgi:hypothetical protein